MKGACPVDTQDSAAMKAFHHFALAQDQWHNILAASNTPGERITTHQRIMNSANTYRVVSTDIVRLVAHTGILPDGRNVSNCQPSWEQNQPTVTPRVYIVRTPTLLIVNKPHPRRKPQEHRSKTSKTIFGRAGDTDSAR